MVKKLSFLSTGKPWRSLLLKVLLFGLGLFWVHLSGFSLPALFGFFILIIWLYFSQLPERAHFRISFLVLVSTALLTLYFSQGGFYPAFFACLGFSFLFYLLLGLPALVFKNRQSVYFLLNTGLFLIVFLLFFGADKLNYFLTINFLLFLVVFLLFEECFGFLRSAVHNSLFTIHNSRFISLVFAFLGLELFWVVSLLPIGFVNLAIFETLFVFLTRDFTLAYFSGRFNRQFFIYHLLIFVVLVIFIFTNSKWSI
ncbi:MAG: hypothetical protein AAB514_01030 [Patescibacteria group bacterium]